MSRENKLASYLTKENLIKWVRQIAVTFSVIAVLQITLPTVAFSLISTQSVPSVPIGALIPWLIVLTVSLLTYSIVKKIAGGNIGGLDRDTQNVIIKITVVSLGLASLIPTVWMAIYNMVIFTVEDSLIGWMLTMVAGAAFFVGLVAAWKKTSTVYLFMYFTFNFIVFSVFTVLEPVWIIILFPSFLGMNATLKLPNRERRFFPRFKSKYAKVGLLVALIGISAPVLIIFGIMPSYTNSYTLTADNAADEIELNFTWANATPVTYDAYNNLTYMDAKPNLEVSLTIPLIYGFKGDYEDKIAEGGLTDVSWNLKLMVEEDFETIENTPIDEVDELTYIEDGLVENFTRNFTAGGIDIDFMPLLPKEEYYMYINDATIDRFLKTYAICREYINRSGIGDEHRGIVVDTERDYSDFDKVVANWWDKDLHTDGIVLLDDLLDLMREDQVYWKTSYTRAQLASMTQEQINSEFQILVDAKESHVSCATFQYHLDDFVDFDDEQQHFYEISIIPPTSWDMVGVMTYDKGANSEHNFYGYCRAMDYFFGENAVPYLYSEDSEENIFNKMRIAQNYGFEVIGMWALTSEYCFDNWETTGAWCGGLCDRFGWGSLQRLADALETPEDITFEFDGQNWSKWTYMHVLQLVDLYLLGPNRLPSWPLNGAERIQI